VYTVPLTFQNSDLLNHKEVPPPPDVLLSTGKSTALLSKSSAWLLFTDGEIDEHCAQKFSSEICGHGLHGTACIVVVVGYRASTPRHCNISVGLSVFGSAPDCLFLFHDVDDSRVYILQSNGAFSKLLPTGHTELILGPSRRGNDLPTIAYSGLATIQTPTPCKLGPNEILLQVNKR